MKVRRITISADGSQLQEPSTPWWFVVLVLGGFLLFVVSPSRKDSHKGETSPAVTAPAPVHERTAEEKKLLFWHTVTTVLFIAVESLWGYRRLRHNIRRRGQFRRHAATTSALLARVYAALKIALAQPGLTDVEQDLILQTAERYHQAKSALANQILQSWLPLCEVVWRTGRQTQLAFDLAEEALRFAHSATRYPVLTAMEATASSPDSLPG